MQVYHVHLQKSGQRVGQILYLEPEVALWSTRMTSQLIIDRVTKILVTLLELYIGVPPF